MSFTTPLISKVKKGTFVTFQSTEGDLTYTFNNSNKIFKYSKFALLKIPNIQAANNNQNTVQFENIEGTYTKGLSNASPVLEAQRIDLSQSLQNYALNFETLLLKSETHNPNLHTTVAERVFFKWLKEIGAMRYRGSNNLEKATTQTESRYVEENDNDNAGSGDLYDKVVKYIGEIDIDGSNRNNTNSTKEVYIYIPTQNGKTPTVLFKSFEDANYQHAMAVKKADFANGEYIDGRSSTDDPSSAGLTVKAYYDMDVDLGSYKYYVNGPEADPWFAPLAGYGANSYFTEPTFNDPANDMIVRTHLDDSNSHSYKRSRLDGISVDFQTSSYKYFQDNYDKQFFNQFNEDDSAESFDFNAIAIYYDLIDPSTGDLLATNLYGVLILNDLETVGGSASRIKPNTKVKPNKIIGQQGNGYGFRLNFKFDTNSDIVTSDVQVTVNDYNTFSMQLFSDMMQMMSKTNKNYEDIISKWLEITAKIEEVEQLVLTGDNTQQIAKQIEAIKAVLGNYQPTNGITDILAKLSDKVDQILQGNTTVGLSFALDLKPFDGLGLDLVGNTLSIRNNRQKYVSSQKIIVDTKSNQTSYISNIVSLSYADTLCYHQNDGQKKIAQDNIVFYIDDSINFWKNNQSLKIAIVDDIDMANFGMIFYTDATNKFNLTKPYQKLIGTIPSFQTMKPEIEIICIDSLKYEFIIISK